MRFLWPFHRAFQSKTMKRSLEKITRSDLKKLYELSASVMDSFFERNPIYKKPFQGKQVVAALCQGAALHYIDGKNGVKDFDVWFFYSDKKNICMPYRTVLCADFGKSKFGRIPMQKHHEGRGIDVLMRSDSAFNTRDPVKGITDYLSKHRTKTAGFLSQKAAVGLYPESVFGRVLWPARQG